MGFRGFLVVARSATTRKELNYLMNSEKSMCSQVAEATT
jgi:hypothetical protein